MFKSLILFDFNSNFSFYFAMCNLIFLFDVALAYYMVEDNGEFIANSKHLLQLNMYRRVAACPCSSQSHMQGGTFCNRLMARMKSIACQCEMYKIFMFQMIIKPIVVGLTWWIFVVVIYIFASVFAPIVYIIHPGVFTRHYWCPFGDAGVLLFLIFVFFLLLCQINNKIFANSSMN